MKTRLCLVSVFLYMLSCQDLPFGAGRQDTLNIYTSRALYLRPEPVDLFIENPTNETVHVYECNGHVQLHKDRLVNNEWTLWGQTDCLNDTLSPIIILSKTTFSDTIKVGKPGSYRFWCVFHKSNGDSLILYTNTFEMY
jgi:hypothetical protein